MFSKRSWEYLNIDVFRIVLFELETYCQDKFQNKVNLIVGFFANRVIYFLNQLPNWIKNWDRVEIFKMKLNDFRKRSLKNKFNVYLRELSDKLIESDLYIDILLMLYMFSAKILSWRVMSEENKNWRCPRRHKNKLKHLS